MIGLKILLIIVLSIIFWQDYKERLVFWLLYPLVGIIGFIIQLRLTETTTAFLNSTINLCLVGTVILILLVYTRLILKQSLINNSIGIGDILFFIFLSFCFSVISFFVLFVFSLLFSLSLHVLLKRKKNETVPLAGYMSLFFIAVYSLTFFKNCNFIFAY